MIRNTPGDVEARVLRVLAACLGLEEDEVSPSARLGADLGFSSVDLVDLSFRLDEEFLTDIDLGAAAESSGPDLTARGVADAVFAWLVKNGTASSA